MDGEATVKWMRRQAWCNGKVGVTGSAGGASVGRSGGKWVVVLVSGHIRCWPRDETRTFHSLYM